MVGATTRYPRSLISPKDSPRILISGANNRKLGGCITRGAWAGMPIYQLTLEERATCPTYCPQLSICYGNGMPFARRHKADASIYRRLDKELAHLWGRHSRFAVRLHVLGDFFSVAYVAYWERMLRITHGLHVFGYTACTGDDPIWAAIDRMNKAQPDRCYIRPSATETKVVMKDEPGIVTCPAQTGKTACCGTCALCWTPAFRGKTIGFIKHGIV